MSTIVIVEDDVALKEELSILLNNAGYETKMITSFEKVAKQLLDYKADLILLDITLPNENGEEILKEYRKSSDTPIIMLTSRSGDIDELLSMGYGADDYITKPYNPTLLLLHISAVLKRSVKSSNVMYHDIQVSSIKGTLVKGNEEQVLTKNEMLIFQLLLDHKGEIVSRDELMTVLWDNDEFINDNALSVNISRLRSKLADLGLEDAIETRKKQGYILR